MTSAAVEHLGHRCSVAVDGDEARRIFQAGDVEVLITDWEMPGMDGTALASRIRAEIGSGYTYIMLLTGRADEGSALATMLAGADDYATKPLTLADLKRKLVVAERVTTKHNGMHNDARQDPLTGLGNRWRLSEDLVALCGRVERYGHTYSLALIDTWWNSLSTNGSRMPRPARGPGTGDREGWQRGGLEHRWRHVEHAASPERSSGNQALAAAAADERRVVIELENEPHTPASSQTVMFGRLISEIEILMGSEGRDLDEWETWTQTALIQVGIRGDF